MPRVVVAVEYVDAAQHRRLEIGVAHVAAVVDHHDRRLGVAGITDAGTLDAAAADAGALDAGAGDAGPADAGSLREVPCIDESISQLMLFDVVNEGAIVDESEGETAFHHHIDATAGGSPATEGFVYARFTDEGLERVEIDDEAAFESTEWHIAFRRYIIRLNSGISGPSGVTAGRTAPDTAFDDLTEVPETLELHDEAYFTDTCEYVPDTSGIGAPATLLANFWSYAGCLAMTGNVYVIAIPNGRHVKLEVLTYYDTDAQTACDETGSADPESAGNIRVRWDYLD